MAFKTEFTDEEWARLKRAPFVAGMSISLADPGGPIEAFKETHAMLKSVLDAAGTDERGELVRELAADVREEGRQRKNPLGGFKPKGAASAGTEILDELREVHGVVAAKVPAGEAEAFDAWLLATAQAAADAAKEGGFLGFHAVRVSEGEQAMLDRLRETLA